MWPAELLAVSESNDENMDDEENHIGILFFGYDNLTATVGNNSMYIRKVKMDKKPEEFYDLMESVLFTHNYRPNSEAHRRLKLAKRQFVKRYAELKGIEESYLSSDEELADNSSSQLVSRPEKHSRVPVDISAVRLNDKGGRMTNTSVAWCYKIAARLTQVDYEGLSALERYEILHFLCDRASDLKEIQEVINEKDEEIRVANESLSIERRNTEMVEY